MAIKRIPIKGISRDPSGQISAEGMCAESLNVQLDMGEVAPMIKMARQWYAVYRVLADHNVVGEHDFASFVELVAAEVPAHEKQPKCEEMQRMASLSFAKHVRLWRADNAPVTGQRFVYYLKIAHRMQEMLGVH